MYIILNPVPQEQFFHMSRLANTAFLLSIIGNSYQFIAPTIMVAVEPNRNNVYYYFALGDPALLDAALLGLVVFWAAAQFLSDHKIAWPTIISGIAAANLANLVIAYSIPPANGGGILNNPNISPTGLFILVLSPALVLLGGILGIIASRKYSRQEKQTITPPATSQSTLS